MDKKTAKVLWIIGVSFSLFLGLAMMVYVYGLPTTFEGWLGFTFLLVLLIGIDVTVYRHTRF
jgi:hypothetical protein